MLQITEEMKIHEKWYEEAKTQTPDTISDFIKRLTTEYKHDYGTICHALAAAAIGGAWAVEHSPTGGITGFQAGAVMWEFIRHWNHSSNKTGLRIVDYDNFLYPQYSDEYQRTLTPSVWEAIQQEAKKNIDEANNNMKQYEIDLVQYKVKLDAFIKKYPDYLRNPEKYERLSMGTGEEWDAYYKESGFEFVPDTPYLTVDKNSNVYKHWQSIVDGIIPFGYRIKD